MQEGRKNLIREYQEKVQDMNKRMSERGLQLFQERFLDQHFTVEPSKAWKKGCLNALRMLSPKALQVGKQVYMAIANLNEIGIQVVHLTNEQFAMLSNSGENAGPVVIGLYGDRYNEFMEESEHLIKIYNENLQKAREEIDAMIKSEFEAENDALQAEYRPKTSGNPLGKA